MIPLKPALTPFLALTCLLLTLAPCRAATVVWGGGDGLWSDANWVVDGVAGQTLPDQTTNDDDITITGGTVTYTPGGDLGFNWGATDLTVAGDGGLNQTATNWWRFNGSGTLTVSGTVTTNASNVEFGLNGSDSANLLIDGGTLLHTGSGEMKVRTGNTGEITGGGTLTTRFLSLGDFGDGAGGTVTDFNVTNGILNLTDGSVSLNGIFISGSNPDGRVVVADGGVFNVGNWTNPSSYASKVTDDTGSVLTLYEDGDGGLTSVPEPSAATLVGGLVVLGLLARRRPAGRVSRRRL